MHAKSACLLEATEIRTTIVRMIISHLSNDYFAPGAAEFVSITSRKLRAPYSVSGQLKR